MYMTVLKMTRQSILTATNLLDINSSNSVHRWLTNQQDTSRADDSILYRVINNDNEIYMYIQSKSKFNIENIEKFGFIFVKSFNFDNADFSNFTHFDIQCFPNRTHNDKRLFIKNINDRYNWLQKKFSEHGIELLECIEYKQSNIVLDKGIPKNIPTATYRGKIQIIDENLAKDMIFSGLGRFKNYGLGLLLIK